MKLAIMQPYIFPYIGYFQLVNAVDKFVFFDDVNFIKKGYINRNNILSNGKSYSFTISCKKISQNKLINETYLNFTLKEKSKLLSSLKQNYQKAPFFKEVYPVIEHFFSSYKGKTISEISADSVMLVAKYLNLKTSFSFSSVRHGESIKFKAAKRIITICEKENAEQYINPIGGVKLYDKTEFLNHGIDLRFIKSKPIVYKQFDGDFVPWLSIIDVMMFNSISDIKQLLNNYEFI